MAATGGLVVSVLSFICSNPICDCIARHISFDNDVSKLKRKFENLKGKKEDIELRKQEHEAAGEEVEQEVGDWLKLVEDISGEVEDALAEAGSFNWYKRYFVSKRICKNITEVEDTLKQGSSFRLEAPARGNIFRTEKSVEGIPSKDEILGYLMGNEVAMIGVWGIGGVGKTTIMKDLNNDLFKSNRFHKVIWVTVSYPAPSVFELQKKIADSMSKTLPKDEEVMKRAATLTKIMGKLRYVLLLDDVWEGFSLEDVGIPEPTVHNGCKIVIISRREEVCDCLGCKTKVRVPLLSPEESLKLFLRTVGNDVLQVPRLKGILKLIVEECAGLPLAIVVIAGSMKGKYDVNEWEYALIELKDRVRSFSGWEDKIFSQLRFSYDRLDNLQIKKCFLYCSLFREGYEFSRRELIEGWIDDGLIDIDDLGSRQKAYSCGHAILKRLVRNSLIEETVKYILGDYEDVFKMHDVVRHMAISIGPEFGYVVKNLIEGQKVYGWPKDFSKLSLMAIHRSKLPVGLSLKSLILSTLILSDNHLLEIPKSLFEDMRALKVLDLSRTDIEALPDSICNLENLSTLRLRGCKRLTCLPSLGELRALKKLDLRGTRIQVVPQGMEMLQNLEYLDLFCKYLKEIPTGILSKLSSLQYLAVSYLGDTIKIDVEEVARLRKLEILQGRFEAIHELNSFVSESKNFQNFTAYGLVLGFGFNLTIEEEDTDKWSFECDYKHWLTIEQPEFDGEEQPEIDGECVVLPANLEDLRIRLWKNMRSSLNKTVLLENATKLKSCFIGDCEGIEYVVELDSSSSSLLYCPILDELERLYLDSVPTLCALVRMEGVATPPCIFSNLKVLFIHYCSGMRKLLPFELLQVLQNLERLEVWASKQMEELIPLSDSDAPSDKFTFTFPKLRALYLVGLPKLKSICSANGVMVCHSIEKIRISGCHELKRIPLQLPRLDDGQPTPPPHLKQIYIDEKESKEWWESVEWDYPNAKNILQPFLKDIMEDMMER